MSDAPAQGGAIRAEGDPRSRRKGDVPEALTRRYFTDDRGRRGLGFYADAKIATPAFRDEGRRLVASRSDPNIARDLAQIARHRGWSRVVVTGDPDFRREVWLAARALGLEVRGYRPTDRDTQDLARRTALEARRSRNERPIRPPRDPTPPPQSLDTPRARSILRVVEKVVGMRVAAPDARDRLLSQARERLARGLEQPDHPPPPRSGVIVEPPSRRERARGDRG